MAVENFSVDCVGILLEKGLSGDMKSLALHKDSSGNSLLHKAVAANNLNCVKHLLKQGFEANIPNKDMDMYSDGGAPIHIGLIFPQLNVLAAQSDSVDMLELLLEHGADINSQV